MADAVSDLLRAQDLLAVGRWEQAVEVLRPHLGADDGSAWELSSYAFLAGARSSEAVVAAREAVAVAPGRPGAHRALGYALLADRRPRQAARAAAEAVTLSPHDWRNALLASSAWLGAGQAGTAVWHARRALQLAPGVPDTHVAVGRCLMTSNPVHARQAFEAALAMQPDHVDAQRFLGHLALGQDRLRAGARELTSAAVRGAHSLSVADMVTVARAWISRTLAAVCVVSVVVFIVVLSLDGGKDGGLDGVRPALWVVPPVVVALVAVTWWRLGHLTRGAARPALALVARSWWGRVRLLLAVIVALSLVATCFGLDGGQRTVGVMVGLVSLVVFGIGSVLVGMALNLVHAVRSRLRDR